ncbi:MAG: hypothetical protein GY926_00645 [bacterium]|nr:hypothetical protein [bacterium]
MDTDSEMPIFDDDQLDAKGEESRRLVGSTTIEGVTVKMSGDKRLIGVRIAPEAIRDWSPQKLGSVVRKAVNRCRAIVDHRASTFCMDDMTAKTRALQAQAPGEADADERVTAVPELVAGVRAALAECGWEIADLAERSGLDELLLSDLLAGLYFPMEHINGQLKGLASAMDVACPLAEAFGLSPEALWAKGVNRIAELDRRERTKIKRLLRGMRLYRRKRKRVDKSQASLKLGELKAQGLTHEYDLEVAIMLENAIEMMRWKRDWMPRKPTRPGLTAEDFGALLAPSGWVLKKNVTREEILRLWELDAKAATEPESVSDDELEWVRELLGLKSLELACTPTSEP